MSVNLSNILSGGIIFNNIYDYMLQSLNVVLPIALGIFGIFIVWALAKRLFIKMVGGKHRPNSRDDGFGEDVDDYGNIEGENGEYLGNIDDDDDDD